MNEFILLNFEEFSPVYGKIKYPSNTLLFRGYNKKFSIISNRPAYFTSNIDVAKAYVRNNSHDLGTFTNTKQLYLYDIRYIQQILLELFTQIESNDKDVLQFCKILTISYGLTSCHRQLELLKETFNNILDNKHYMAIKKYLIEAKVASKKGEIVYGTLPFEPQGLRIGETETDAISLSFLKDLFSGQIDGYIAPKIKSAFHFNQNGYNPAEIVIFDPISSGLEVVKTKYKIHNQNFKKYVLELNDHIHFQPKIISNLIVNPGLINKCLSKSSMMIGGYIDNCNIYNKILDEGGNNYDVVQEKVKRTIKKLFGNNYYSDLQKDIQKKYKAKPVCVPTTNGEMFGGYGIRIQLKDGFSAREIWKKSLASN